MLKEGNWSESQLLEGMEQFTERLTKQTDEHNDNAPFSFLSKLNDSQVLYLIKDEDTRIKALVMSQLPAQRAADMFLRLSEKELANVAFELGQFESLPVSAFKDVADRLARASLTVPSFENISADGLSVLIRMLDSMTMTEETRLLKTLKSEKPETYYRLRQVYFTFADLARTPDRVISNELRELDRGVLASALCHSSIEFKRHVLAALPQKLRAGVIAELKVAESENSTEVIEQARLNIVQAMRAVIRAGRFSMDELVQISQG
jgi:flagellar motor switch protein FliG